ncbi:hypothetical protein KVV02_003444 [Mortierella alpina]|uniref:Tyrosyl-DNA phosphodiesterase n=1 Tax=Mortierella alpina TaxID=64518 RepID=A0A9P8A177_MORAP|nr:hypothetical protein KVV02_003444 [Mortierella alpina]
MDYSDDEAEMAEAIRLSLLEPQPVPQIWTAPGVKKEPGVKREPGLSSSSASSNSLPAEPSYTNTPTFHHMNHARVVRVKNEQAFGHEDEDKDDEDDDNDLKRALALSLATSPPISSVGATGPVKSEPRVESVSNGVPPPEPANPSLVSERAFSVPSAFGISRAEMERERQERLLKRSLSAATSTASMKSEYEGNRTKKRHVEETTFTYSSASPATSSSSSSSSSSIPIPKISPASTTNKESPSSARSSLSSSRTSTASWPTTTPLSSTSSRLSSHSTATTRSESLYPDIDAYPPQYTTATFRNTYIQGTVPGKWTIRFQDLVSRDHIVKAVLTTFMLDEPWLEKFLPRSVPQCLVTHWSKEQGDQPGFLTDGKVTYLHPPLNGFGTFHPKLMLLFYPTFCRVVVSSANLVSHDWEQLVNTVYVQDFTLLPVPVQSPEELGEFGATLYNYLKVMTVPEKILSVLKCVDLKPAKVLLIPSVQGSFPIANDYTYGIAQLARVMQPRCAADQEWELEYQTSSLGKLTLKFLAEIYRASKGLPPRSRSKLDDMDVMPPIKVIFPTERHVQSSRLGEMGAGTICFQEQYWSQATYPRRVMHDFECAGELKGSLMHTKLIVAKNVPPSRNARRSEATAAAAASRSAGWFYIGSANFTESAWGTVIAKKPAKASTAVATSIPPAPTGSSLHISMRNWELGIVYVIETEDEMQAMTRGLGGQESGQSFFGPLPVPYKRPLKPYDALDRPWIR